MCRAVDDAMRPERSCNRRHAAVAYVEPVEPGPGVDVVLPAGRQIVHHEHIVALLDEPVDDVGADEAGAAGYENAISHGYPA